VISRNFRTVIAVLASLGLAGCVNTPYHSDWRGEDEFGVKSSESIQVTDGICRNPALQVMEPGLFREEAKAWQAWGTAKDPAFKPARGNQADTYDNLALPRAGIEGAVMLFLKVETDGSLAAVEAVCATHPDVIGAAKRVVEGQQFQAATLKGSAVRSVLLVPVVFGPPL